MPIMICEKCKKYIPDSFHGWKINIFANAKLSWNGLRTSRTKSIYQNDNPP